MIKCACRSIFTTFTFGTSLLLGIDIKNAETFFKMLVEIQGADTVDASTFANACVRMKGAATSIDLQTVMFNTHLMTKDVLRELSEPFLVCFEPSPSVCSLESFAFSIYIKDIKIYYNNNYISVIALNWPSSLNTLTYLTTLWRFQDFCN